MVFLKPYSELLACVLKTSVTMEQWMCIRLMSHGLIKSVHNKRNVVTTADFKLWTSIPM